MKKSSSRSGVEIVESLHAAASRLAVELHEVKAAKKAGCPAFKPGGRVNVGELRDWLGDQKSVAAAQAIPAARPDLSTLDNSLAGAVEVEENCLAAVRAARTSGNLAAVPELTSAYGMAQKNRLRVSLEVGRQRERSGELMTLSQHKIELHRLWHPIVTAFRQLPRTLALQVAPGTDVEAEKIIATAVEGVITECRRALQHPPDAEYHFALWQLAVLRDEGGQRALERFDAARKMITDAIARGEKEGPKTQVKNLANSCFR